MRFNALMLLLILLVAHVGAEVYVSGADVIKNVTLQQFEVQTTAVPVSGIFSFNQEAAMESDLVTKSIQTEPVPLKTPFLVNSQASVTATLSETKIETSSHPLVRPFLFNQEVKVQQSLDYPRDLLYDQVPPKINNVTAFNMTRTSVEITWDTDDYANSEVAFGFDPGNWLAYSGDELLAKTHNVTLDNLTPGSKYYYQVNSTDRNGYATVGDISEFETLS